MADLRARFLEDYAGGLLNVSRQELASNGEVLSQDGFFSDSTIFVEDGVGTKSGLRLGVGLAESVDPTTQTGLVNVRYADRTYTKIRDTKVFATAIASAQAALAESVTESITNIESAIDYLEIFDTQSDSRISSLESEYNALTSSFNQQTESIKELKSNIESELSDIKLGVDSKTNNLRLGVDSLAKLSNGSANVALGFYSLGELFSGGGNIAIGAKSGFELIQGDNNILIGDDSNTSSVKASNQIVIGNSKHATSWINTDFCTPAEPLSSLDSIISTMSDSQALDLVKQLEFQTIMWESGQTSVVIVPDSIRAAEEGFGLKGYIHSESPSVANAKLVPIMLKAIKRIAQQLQL